MKVTGDPTINDLVNEVVCKLAGTSCSVQLARTDQRWLTERTHLYTWPPIKNVTFQHSGGYKSHLETVKAFCPCTVFIFIGWVLCTCMHEQHDQSILSEQLPLGRQQHPLALRWCIWLSRVCKVTKNSCLETCDMKFKGHHQEIRRGIVGRIWILFCFSGPSLPFSLGC